MNTYNPYKMFCGSFIPNWLEVRTEISAAAKLCFGRLCRFAGEDGKCFPKVEILAAAIGAKKRMTQRYLRELEKFKLIKVINQGSYLPNSYEFLWHEWIGQQNQGVSYLTPPPMSDLTPPYKENNNINNINILSNSKKENVYKSESKKLKEQAKEVLEYLNSKSLSRFRCVDSNLTGIIARLNEKVSVIECKGVVDMKVKEWKNTDMEKYLRPATLFRKSNFENYYGKYLPIQSASATPMVSNSSSLKVYTRFEIDKYFPLSDNLSAYKRKYNALQREGIQAMVKHGEAMIR